MVNAWLTRARCWFTGGVAVPALGSQGTTTAGDDEAQLWMVSVARFSPEAISQAAQTPRGRSAVLSRPSARSTEQEKLKAAILQPGHPRRDREALCLRGCGAIKQYVVRARDSPRTRGKMPTSAAICQQRSARRQHFAIRIPKTKTAGSFDPAVTQNSTG